MSDIKQPPPNPLSLSTSLSHTLHLSLSPVSLSVYTRRPDFLTRQTHVRSPQCTFTPNMVVPILYSGIMCAETCWEAQMGHVWVSVVKRNMTDNNRCGKTYSNNRTAVKNLTEMNWKQLLWNFYNNYFHSEIASKSVYVCNQIITEKVQFWSSETDFLGKLTPTMFDY